MLRRLLAGLLAALQVSLACAANPVFDNLSEKDDISGLVTSITNTLTVAAGATGICIGTAIVANATKTPTVTLNSGAVTLTLQATTGFHDSFYQAWVYCTTTTPPTGTVTWLVSMNAAPDFYFAAAAASVTGGCATSVLAATPTTATGNSAAPTATGSFTVGASELGMDFVFLHATGAGTVTANSGQTARGASPYVNSSAIGISTANSTGSLNLGWQGFFGTQVWSDMGFSFKGACGGAAVVPMMRVMP